MPRAELPSGFVSLLRTRQHLPKRRPRHSCPESHELPRAHAVTLPVSLQHSPASAWPLPGSGEVFRKPVHGHQREVGQKGGVTARGHPILLAHHVTLRPRSHIRKPRQGGRKIHPRWRSQWLTRDRRYPGGSALGFSRRALPAICLFPPPSGDWPASAAAAGPPEVGVCPASPAEFQ